MRYNAFLKGVITRSRQVLYSVIFMFYHPPVLAMDTA